MDAKTLKIFTDKFICSSDYQGSVTNALLSSEEMPRSLLVRKTTVFDFDCFRSKVLLYDYLRSEIDQITFEAKVEEFIPR